MSDWLVALYEAPLVVVPLVGGIVLVLYVVGQRLADGVSPVALPLDGKFLKAFLYTGALLAIWLSCYHFYGVLAAGGVAQ